MSKFYQLKNYEDLDLINKNGVLRNKSGLTMKPLINEDGYKIITLFKNGQKRNYFIHRLVAQNFITNPSNLPQVNHKNLDRSENRVSNLEWCTIQTNALERGDRKH